MVLWISGSILLILCLWPGVGNNLSVCLCQFVISCCISHCYCDFYLWGLNGVLHDVEMVEAGSEPPLQAHCWCCVRCSGGERELSG